MDILDLLDDFILSLFQLRDDTYFNKLSNEEVKYYISESIRLGKNLSKSLREKDIEALLKENGIEIEVIKGKDENLSLRAEIEFSKEIKKIKIYEDSIIDVYNNTKNHRFNLNKEDIYKIHLAHEFYHFLEYKYNIFTNERLKKITLFKLGPFKRESTILMTREIAAHSFCKEILKLDFHPKLLDYMYLIKKDPNYKQTLIKEIDEYRNRFLK